MSIRDVTFVVTEMDEYDDAEPYQKVLGTSELTKEQFAKIAHLTGHQVIKSQWDYQDDLRKALENLNKNSAKKILKENGYLPANEAEKVGKMTVDASQLYTKGNYGDRFNPVDMNNYSTENAIKSDGPLYCKVILPSTHPFMVARKEYNRKKEEKRKKAQEKKKQREIEKAKKLLEKEGEI
jgi:hypothetical protein